LDVLSNEAHRIAMDTWYWCASFGSTYELWNRYSGSLRSPHPRLRRWWYFNKKPIDSRFI